MKKVLFTMFIFMTIGTGCVQDNRTEYTLTTKEYLPVENQDKCAKAIADIMRGSSQQLTTSDYENVDDAIAKATYSVTQIYKAEKVVLVRDKWTYYDIDKLTPYQQKIYEELQNKPIVRIQE